MSFSTLLEHNATGWDIDGTLLGHPNSRRMADFIRATPEKRHVLVTFRSHELVPRIWVDLFREPTRLTEKDFSGLVRMQDAMFEREYNMGRSPAGLFIPTQNYLEWKGKMCNDYGLTVLVDDATDQVRPGCDRYGILHIHPDDL
jgi:hypothetical protein